MTDKEIKKLFDIPHTTLWMWKNEKSSIYKKKIYDFLRALTIEEAKNVFERINKKLNNS